MESFGECCKELKGLSVFVSFVVVVQIYLGLSCLAFISRYTNLVEYCMQLTNDGGDLGCQVAGVHRDESA